MGYSQATLSLVRGLLPSGGALCDLGDQTLNGLHMHDFFSGHRYVSVDVNGKSTHRADLNKWPNEALSLGQFDVVTNLGTTEHLANQLNAFATVHQLTKVNGYAVHQIPTLHYLSHGFVNVTPRFMLRLADANKYEIIKAQLQPTWLDEGLAYHLGSDLKEFEGGDLIRVPQGVLMLVVFRKIEDTPFVDPLDLEEAPDPTQFEVDAFTRSLIGIGLSSIFRGAYFQVRAMLRPMKRLLTRR